MFKLPDIIDDIAIGAPVRVELSALPGRKRSAIATVVFAALDVETDACRVRFAKITSETGAWLANSMIVLRKLVAIDNLSIGADLERYGSLRDWACESSAGRQIMAAAIPVYLEQSRPTYEELETLQQAVYLMITNGEDKNPYEIATHVKDCEGTVWDDPASDTLLSIKALKRCPACLSQRTLWESIIKRFGTSEVGRRAQYALDQASRLKQFRPPENRISVRDWEYAQIASSEVRKRKRYHNWKAGQDAKNR